MSTEQSKVKKVDYPVYELEAKGRLVLPVEIINQILYLHSNVGKTEWSGILLYNVLKGNPSKPADFVLRAEHIFLMDIGTAGYTEYETDSDIVDLYDNIEGSMEMKIGHVHSHHDMSAFFSGTDMDELMQNSDKHNYYLSLIVNFSGNYVAKVSFISERKVKSEMYYTDDSGVLKKFIQEKNEKTLVVLNMDIILEYNNSFFYNRLKEVKEKIQKAKEEAERKRKYVSPNYGFNGGQTKMSLPRDIDYDWKERGKPEKRDKKAPDPSTLSTPEINRLLRNLLAVDTELKETRPVFEILKTLSEASEAELEMYCDYFSDNIEVILEEFFQENFYAMEDSETQLLISDLTFTLKRFETHVNLKSVTDKVIECLNLYYVLSTDSEGAAHSQQIAEYEEELKELQKTLKV